MAVQRQMPSAQSVEQIRARARRRLIGAFVLVILAIGIFAWLFDSSPRQTNVDIPVEIAEQTNSSEVLQGGTTDTLAHTDLSTGTSIIDLSPTLPMDGASAPEGTIPDGTPVGGADPLQPPATVANSMPETHASQGGDAVQATSVGQYGVRPANKPYLRSKYPPRLESQSTAGQRAGLTEREMRAAALLGELPAPQNNNASNGAGVRKPDDSQQSFVVQVGAYAEQDKVNEVRAKLTLAGYQSFVQEVQTSAGKRIRVRVGPFEGRRSADAAADKIKVLGLPTSVMAN